MKLQANIKRVYVVKLYNVYIYQNIAVTIQQQITSSKYGDGFRWPNNIGIKGRTEYYQFCLVLHFKQFLYSNGESWCNSVCLKKHAYITRNVL